TTKCAGRVDANMLTSTAIAILIQTVCIVAALLYVRRRWITSVGFIFVVTAWIYHAGSEILNNLLPGRNLYRTLVSAEQIGRSSLWCSAVLASFTVAYL